MNSNNTISLRVKDDNENVHGHYYIHVQKPSKIYERDFYIERNWQNPWHEDSAKSLLRKIAWCDYHGLRISKAGNIGYLRRKMGSYRDRYILRDPCFFDHTTYWRLDGQRWPVLCLTEPYGHATQNGFQEKIDELKNEGYELMWYPPSKHSLHNESTNMVFIWDPNFFTFEEKYHNSPDPKIHYQEFKR